jgi:hypothetical protein
MSIHGVLKHVDAGLKLLPERGSRGCIHDRALTRYSKNTCAGRSCRG